MLAHIDFSWRQTQATPPEITEVDSFGLPLPKEGDVDLHILTTHPSSDHNQGEIGDIEFYEHHETPLLLAAANGIIEIVQQIVEVFPQAVDYVTHDDGICIDDCVDSEVRGDEVDGEFVVYGDVFSGDHVYNNSAPSVCGISEEYLEIWPQDFQVSSHGVSCSML
uniref:Uncharacterized protein n=1 Tax=Cucumis sativus TaxID=3659 RepID=A0A0A0M140_CUCSA